MASPTQAKRLDFGGTVPEEAREQIRALLADDSGASGKIYAALAHKVWSLLIERRLDGEVRDWHVLLQGVRASLRRGDERLSERVAALADLVRESVALAERSPARDVARRPHARKILEILAAENDFVARRRLNEELQLSNSHLSNVLVQLGGVGLIERRDRGKEAEFALTALGRELTMIPGAASSPNVRLATTLMLGSIDTIDYMAIFDAGKKAAAEAEANRELADASDSAEQVSGAAFSLPHIFGPSAHSLSLWDNHFAERFVGKPRSIDKLLELSDADGGWKRARTGMELRP